MQAHDLLFADTADDCTTGIGTRHRRATEETQKNHHPYSRESIQASDRDNRIQSRQLEKHKEKQRDDIKKE